MASGFSAVGAYAALNGGPKTLLYLTTPAAATQIILTEISISFDGVSAAAVPITVNLYQSTAATAGTPGSGVTPVLIRGYNTTVCTANQAYTVEPTALTTIKSWYVTPNGGLFVLQFPLGREPVTNWLWGTAVKGYGISCTTGAAVDIKGTIEWEE